MSSCAPGNKDVAPTALQVTRCEYAAELGIAQEEALKKSMEAKSKEFAGRGAEVYSQA